MPDVDLLLQCSGSSAQMFPTQEVLGIILQGDSRTSHGRLGKGQKRPVAVEIQQRGAQPWGPAAASRPTVEVTDSYSED